MAVYAKKWVVNLSVLLVTLVLFFIILEAAVRFLGLAPVYGYPKGLFQDDKVVDYSMTPNFTGTFVKQEFELEVSTNAEGLRDEEIAKKEDDEVRILALGDSFTWGAYGTELNETFLKVLQSKLNSDSEEKYYRVINSGVPGYSTKQEFSYLTSRGIKFEPDVVLLNFVVANDFFDNSNNKNFTVKNGVLGREDPTNKNLAYVRAFLLINLHSYRIIEKSIINLFSDFINEHIRGKLQQSNSQAELFKEPKGETLKNQVEETKSVLSNMDSYLKSEDIELVVVLIPLKYQVDDNLKKIFIKNNLKDYDSYNFRYPQEVIKEWGENNGVEVVDLLPGMERMNKNNDFYWKLNPHFNKKGNEVAAEIIYAELKKEGVLNPDD